MHRTPLIQLLHRYTPSFPEEVESKVRILQFVEQEPQCFERSLQKGHMTASCWLLNHDKTKALLMHHAKLGCWLQLGGHADGDEDLLQVAIKEAKEESGIEAIDPISSDIFDLDVHFIPENTKEKAHYHYDVRFLLQVKTKQEPRKNRESKEFLWVDKEGTNLPTQEPSILRLFTKWAQMNPN